MDDPLESVDEVVFLEEDDDGEKTTPAPQRLPALSSKVRTNPLFAASSFPALAFDRDFRIVFANEPCKKLLGGKREAVGRSFIDVFGKAFQIEDVRGIREVVLGGASSRSWKGLAQIKSGDVPTMVVRVYIYPGSFAQDKRPAEFITMFDDVTEEQKSLLRAVFEKYLSASILRENGTKEHNERLNDYSTSLARALRGRSGYEAVDADFIDDIGFLASMHDVGKIGTPDDILNKEGPLSHSEWEIIKQHTVNGAYLLSPYPNPMAVEIALGHHEWWNGKGYPYGKEREDIPLSARIVSLADAYDAIRMKRPYKGAFSHAVAVERILESSGTQFDPRLVEIWKSVTDEFDELYRAHAD